MIGAVRNSMWISGGRRLIPWTLEQLRQHTARAVSAWGAAATLAVAFVATSAGVLAQQRDEVEPHATTNITPSRADVKKPGETTTATPETLPAAQMTLQDAITRLIHNDFDLRVQFWEIPAAQADVLQASLCADPERYADAQLVPLGELIRLKPGGRREFDVNVVYPLDVSHKRASRTASAIKARRVIEAQYQDAVRLRLDALYTAFIDVLAARESVHLRQATFNRIRDLARTELKGHADRDRLNDASLEARKAQREAMTKLEGAKATLGRMLHMRDDEVRGVEFRGELRPACSKLAPVESLLRTALESRPDLAAFRFGLKAAEAGLERAQAQHPEEAEQVDEDSDNVASKTATESREARIARAKTNLAQSKVELATQERQINGDVQDAARQLDRSEKQAYYIAEKVLPNATQVLNDTVQLYAEGQVSTKVVLTCVSEYDTLLLQELDTLVNRCRNRYRLNTAVGRRLLK
jgi:cobalt-zinc-cadmium efflux system outer membrane protein